MNPQHSSEPERSRCASDSVCNKTRSKCMYLHHKVLKSCDCKGRMCGSIDPNHMTLSRSKVAFSRILYPPVDPVRIPGCSPPTSGWIDVTDIPSRSSGFQSIYSYSRSRCKKPPDKGKCMYPLVDLPDPPQAFIFIQSNRKNRPFSNPSSWAVPKTWRSLERKQHKEIITCH